MHGHVSYRGPGPGLLVLLWLYRGSGTVTSSIVWNYLQLQKAVKDPFVLVAAAAHMFFSVHYKYSYLLTYLLTYLH